MPAPRRGKTDTQDDASVTYHEGSVYDVPVEMLLDGILGDYALRSWPGGDREVGTTDDLESTLHEHGQAQPVLVTVEGESASPRMRVVAGRRRAAAVHRMAIAKEPRGVRGLGVGVVRVLVVSEASVTRGIMIGENTGRRDLTLSDWRAVAISEDASSFCHLRGGAMENAGQLQRALVELPETATHLAGITPTKLVALNALRVELESKPGGAKVWDAYWSDLRHGKIRIGTKASIWAAKKAAANDLFGKKGAELSGDGATQAVMRSLRQALPAGSVVCVVTASTGQAVTVTASTSGLQWLLDALVPGGGKRVDVATVAGQAGAAPEASTKPAEKAAKGVKRVGKPRGASASGNGGKGHAGGSGTKGRGNRPKRR